MARMGPLSEKFPSRDAATLGSQVSVGAFFLLCGQVFCPLRGEEAQGGMAWRMTSHVITSLAFRRAASC